MDPYAVLGVGRGSTPAEIRAAYLRRSKELHPDHYADATPEQRDAAIRNGFLQSAQDPIGGTAEAFSRLVHGDFEKYGRLVKELDIHVN